MKGDQLYYALQMLRRQGPLRRRLKRKRLNQPTRLIPKAGGNDKLHQPMGKDDLSVGISPRARFGPATV